MCSAKDLHQKVTAFYGRAAADPHHRYRSWEHCYRFFRSRTREGVVTEKDAAALQLGFHLASWGMYRGSSFLLQHAYTVHAGVVERLASPEFSPLWEKEVGSEVSDLRLVRLMLAAAASVKEAYAPFGAATDTLATKVIPWHACLLARVRSVLHRRLQGIGPAVLVPQCSVCREDDPILHRLQE